MNNQQIKEFGTIFWLHLLLIILIYLSPFLFKWGLVLLFVGLYYFQLLVFGDCILTKIQFKSQEKIVFYHYYLSKLGLNFSKRKINALVTYILPPIILLFTLFWQIILNKIPVF